MYMLEIHTGGYSCTCMYVLCVLSICCVPMYVSLCTLEFRTGKSPILLATDVASRGLGILLFNHYLHVSICEVMVLNRAQTLPSGVYIHMCILL